MMKAMPNANTECGKTIFIIYPAWHTEVAGLLLSFRISLSNPTLLWLFESRDPAGSLVHFHNLSAPPLEVVN